MRLAGVALSENEEKPTGLCLISDTYFSTKTIFRDDKIIKEIKNFRTDIVSINAPLTLSKEPFRQSEKELIKRGFNFLPLDLTSLQKLTKRAINIKNELKNFKIIECHTITSAKILKINKSTLEDFLEKNGFILLHEIKNDSEYNSLIAGITTWFYASGDYESIGKKGENIIIPKI